MGLRNLWVEAGKLAACIVVITLATCCTMSRPVPGQTDEIGFRISAVHLEFDRRVDGKWNAIVQELTLDDGTALVEAFKSRDSNSTLWDRHAWGGTHERTMKVYLAVVEDVDWSPAGFAHLPQNMDGSVRTTVGRGFNATHQQNYETRGRIVDVSDEYFTWRISATDQWVEVEAP